MRDNTVTDNEYIGIYLFYSESNKLRDNTISGSHYNFCVAGGTLAEYTQDIDTSNTVNGKPIYYWVGEKNKKIPSDAGYVGVINSQKITVSGLTLKNVYPGVLFAYTTDSIIEDTCVIDSYHGIHLRCSDGNTVSGNTMTDNEMYGIALIDSVENTVSGNRLN